MYKGLKRVAASIMAAALAMTALAGCSKKDTAESEAAAAAEAQAKALVTLGDASVSAGAFEFMLRYNMATDWLSSIYRSMYGQDVDVWSYDLYGNGQVYGDTVKEELLHEVQHMLLEQEHMEEYGISLTDDEKAAITKAASDFLASNEEELLTNMCATQENVETMLTLRTIQSKMEEAMSADVDTVVSDEEAAQRAVSYVSFTASTESESEGETEELSETEAAAEASDLGEMITEAAAEAETVVEEIAEEAETAVEAAAAEAESEVKTKSADETEAAVEEAESEAAMEEVETEAETETEDPAMVQAREEAMAAASAFLESVKGVDSEGFEAAAEEAAQQEHAENGSWTFGSDSTYPDAQIITATEGLADNTLVENVITVGETYYVVYVTSAFDEEATEERKVEIVEERKQARIESLLESWEGGSEEAETSDETEGASVTEAAEFTIDEEAFAAIAFDYLLYQEEETEEDIEEFSTEILTEEGLTEGISEAGTEVVSVG